MRGAGDRTQLHLYFGEGKGKTTAALGQALRAWGRGWRVLFVQFLKDARAGSGEVEAARRMGPRFRVLRGELPAPVLKEPGSAGKRALRRASAELLGRALAELRARRYDLLVLDEALVAVHYRFLVAADLGRAYEVAADRGARLVVFTGRWTPKGILRQADLVTEVRKERHPYDRGRRAEKGIEY